MSYTPELEIHLDIPLKQKLLKKWFWLYFFAFLIAPTGYIIKLIAARTMSVEDIGLFYSILGLIGIVASYNDLGLTESLQYFLPKYLIARDYIKAKSILITTWAIQFLSGIIVWVGLWFGAPWLAEHYFESESAIIILKWFCLYFLTFNLFQVMQSLFLAAQDTKMSNWIDVARMWIVLWIIILIWQIDPESVNILTITYAWIIWLILSVVIALRVFWLRFWGMMTYYPTVWNIKMFREWIGYAWWVFLWANTSTILTQIDLQFALYFLGKEAAGYRTIYLSLLTAINLLTTPLSVYLFPLVNELVIKNHIAKLNLLMRYLWWWLIILALVIWISAYYLWPQIAQLLFGSEFKISWELLAFAAPWIMFAPAIWFAFSYLAGKWKVKERVWILSSWLVVNIFVNLLLIPSMWLRGLILAMAFSYFIMWIGVILVIRK